MVADKIDKMPRTIANSDVTFMGGVYQGLGGAKPPHEATYFQAFLDGGYCDNNMFNGLMSI